MHHVQDYIKKVATVAEARWQGRTERFIGTEIWLNGLGAAQNQRLPAEVTWGIEERGFLLRTHLIQGVYLIRTHPHHTLL